MSQNPEYDCLASEGMNSQDCPRPCVPEQTEQSRCPKCDDRMVKFPTFEWQRKIANDYYLCLACKHREQITFDPNKLSPADFAKDDFDKIHACRATSVYRKRKYQLITQTTLNNDR